MSGGTQSCVLQPLPSGHNAGPRCLHPDCFPGGHNAGGHNGVTSSILLASPVAMPVLSAAVLQAHEEGKPLAFPHELSTIFFTQGGQRYHTRVRPAKEIVFFLNRERFLTTPPEPPPQKQTGEIVFPAGLCPPPIKTERERPKMGSTTSINVIYAVFLTLWNPDMYVIFRLGIRKCSFMHVF